MVMEAEGGCSKEGPPIVLVSMPLDPDLSYVKDCVKAEEKQFLTPTTMTTKSASIAMEPVDQGLVPTAA